MVRAFLGTGLLGAGFARAMLRRGESARVWNRTAAKAQALAAAGAEVMLSAADAVAGADIVHLTLRDDAVVDEVLASAASRLKAGALLLDHTTTSVDGARRRTADWQKQGLRYLHAPVFMGPQQALECKGTMMVGGDTALVAAALAEITPMTGHVEQMGSDPGAAAAIKLIGNLYSAVMLGGIADVLNVAKGAGLPLAAVRHFFGQRDLNARMQGMLQEACSVTPQTPPSWELTMARKDVRLALEEGAKSGHRMAALPAVAAEMDHWLADGLGHADWSIFASASAH